MDKQSINNKVLEVIQRFEPAAAIVELLSLQKNQPNVHAKKWIRQPILFILQNQHDWDSVVKCLKSWKNMQQFESDFFNRMQQRVGQQITTNLSQTDMRRQYPRLIQKYQSIHQKQEPTIRGIERYLENPSKAHSVIQRPKFTLRQSKAISEPQKPQPKIEEPTLKIQVKKQQSQKNIDVHSNSSKQMLQIVKPLQKKPTFGTLTRKSNNQAMEVKPVSRRFTLNLSEKINNVSQNIVELAQKHVPKNKEIIIDKEIAEKRFEKQNIPINENQIMRQVDKAKVVVQKQLEDRFVTNTKNHQLNQIQSKDKRKTSPASFMKSIKSRQKMVIISGMKPKKQVVPKKKYNIDYGSSLAPNKKTNDDLDLQFDLRQDSKKSISSNENSKQFLTQACDIKQIQISQIIKNPQTIKQICTLLNSKQKKSKRRLLQQQKKRQQQQIKKKYYERKPDQLFSDFQIDQMDLDDEQPLFTIEGIVRDNIQHNLIDQYIGFLKQQDQKFDKYVSKALRVQ